MNIAIPPYITFQRIFKVRCGIVGIFLNTFCPIDELFLNPFEKFFTLREGDGEGGGVQHFLGPSS